MTNPFTDQIAAQLYILTPRAAVTELLAIDTPPGGHWENIDPRVREIFRARARRFLQGDLSVEPWRLQPTRAA